MVSENQTHWSADGRHLPSIEAHTKIKHKVLEEYIKRWVETLAGHGKYGARRLTIVDGYAGGGLYRDGTNLWEGSPIRLIRKFEEGLQYVLARKPYLNTDFEFIFIDSNLAHIKCLELQIKSSGLGSYLENEKCKLIHADFNSNLDSIVKNIEIRKGHSFFFLDPFDLDVNPSMTKRILSLPKTEVLLNHMVSGLYRILGNKTNKYANFFNDFGYDEFFRDEAVSKNKIAKYSYLRHNAIKLFRESGGGNFIHTFALIDKKTAPLYYLMHLSNNPVALAVMRDVTWSYNNLDFQYQYNLFGYGQVTLEEYEQNLTIINVDDENSQFCIDQLSEQVGSFLSQDSSVKFIELYNDTLQENPATKEHYIKALNQLQSNKEIVVLRDGKIKDIKSITSNDIVRRVERQVTIFDTSSYRSKQSELVIPETRKSSKRTVIESSSQLNIDSL